jgi:hypothetical protein
MHIHFERCPYRARREDPRPKKANASAAAGFRCAPKNHAHFSSMNRTALTQRHENTPAHPSTRTHNQDQSRNHASCLRTHACVSAGIQIQIQNLDAHECWLLSNVHIIATRPSFSIRCTKRHPAIPPLVALLGRSSDAGRGGAAKPLVQWCVRPRSLWLARTLHICALRRCEPEHHCSRASAIPPLTFFSHPPRPTRRCMLRAASGTSL